jgi:predicted  nucleic acid-binding Zn-ribbon protein
MKSFNRYAFITRFLATSLTAMAIPVIAHALPSSSYDDYDLEKYEKLYAEAQETLTHRESDLESATRDYERAIAEEESINRELERVYRDLENGRSEFTRLQRRQDTARSSLRNLRNDLQQQRRILADLENRVRDAARRVQELENQWREKKQAIDRKRGELTQVESRIRELASQINSTRSQIESKNRSITSKQNEKNSLESRITSARSQISNLNSQISSQKSELSQAESDLPTLKQRRDQLRVQLRRMQQRIADIDRQIREAQVDEDEELVKKLKAQKAKLVQARNTTSENLKTANANVIQKEKRITALKNSINTNTKKVRSLNSNIGNWTREVSSLTSQISSLQGERDSLASRLQGLNQQLTAANRTRSQVQSAITSLERDFASLNQEYQRRRTSHERLQSEARESRREISRLESRENDLSREVDSIERNLSRLERELYDLEQLSRGLESDSGRAQQQTQRESERYARAEDQVRSWTEEVNKLYNRVVQVQNNIEQARQEVTQIATRHGTSDGTREGTEDGQREGNQQGEADGIETGTKDGTAAGKKQWYDHGYEQGEPVGINLGEQQAMDASETNGKKDGTQEGTKDGLQFAYDTGYERGLATANDQSAYQESYKTGFAEGWQRAKDEAKAQEPVGYQDKEQEFLTAPLKEVEVGQRPKTLAENFAGLQAGTSSSSEGRYYNPRPDRYPHDRIKQFYMGAYDYAYRDSMATAFESAYNASYDKAYEARYNEYWDKHANMEYPESQQEGYDDGVEDFRKKTYRTVYDKEYPIRKKHYYDIAFAANKDDAEKIAEGFAAGNFTASSANGLKDGKAKGYSQNIENEKTLAYNRGVSRASNKYENNAILELVSAQLIDASGDNFFVPGEKAAFTVVVKNFGLTSSGLLKSKLLGNAEQIDAVADGLNRAVIAGQTLTKIHGVASFAVKKNLQVGQRITVGSRLLEGNNEIFSSDQALSVSYPITWAFESLPEVVLTNNAREIAIRLSNQSNVGQKLNIVLQPDMARLVVPVVFADVELSPKGSEVIKFKVSGRMDALFEKAKIGLQMIQNQLLIAREGSAELVVGIQHENTEASKALIVGADLSLESARNMMLATNVDTWDLRIDGLGLNSKVLEKYIDKSVHFLLSRELVHANVFSALSTFTDKGGMVVMWGDVSLLDSELLKQFGIVGLENTTVQNLVGRDILRDLDFTASAYAKSFALSGNATPVLMSGERILASQAQVKPFNDMPGRWIAIGFDSESVQKEVLADVFVKLQDASKGFDEKYKLAQSDFTKIPLVLNDLTAEVRADDADEDTKWLNKKKKTKLYKVIKKYLKKDNKELQKEFASYYPEMYLEIQDMQDQRDKRSAEYIVERVSVNGWAWKTYYCRYYRDQDQLSICD